MYTPLYERGEKQAGANTAQHIFAILAREEKKKRCSAETFARAKYTIPQLFKKSPFRKVASLA